MTVLPTKEKIMFQKYIVPAIGVGAFIVGGLVAREKSIEVVDLLEKVFKSPSTPSS